MKANWTVAWDDSLDGGENARAKLPELAAEYIARGTAIATPEAAPEELHQLRLATKHFRYTLEAFRPVYGEPLETWLGELKQVQQYLGEINDCRVTRDRFEGDITAMPLLKFLEARFLSLRADFLKYWRKRFAPAGRVEAWRRFLAAPPPAPVSRRSRTAVQRRHRQAKAG